MSSFNLNSVLNMRKFDVRYNVAKARGDRIKEHQQQQNSTTSQQSFSLSRGQVPPPIPQD